MENFHTDFTPDQLALEPTQSGFLRFVIDVAQTLVLSLVLFLAINAVSARIKVDGYSMEPTLRDGEFVIVNRLSYKYADPKYGDIIVFPYPANPNQEYIKRVIGVPGDEIVIAGGTVSVNGEILGEEYIKAPPAYTGSWIVPDDSLFVLGDNRNNSSDSHNWGWVPAEEIVGKAIFVYWPFTDVRILERPSDVMAAP